MLSLYDYLTNKSLIEIFFIFTGDYMSEETVAGSQSAAVSVQDSTKFHLEPLSLKQLKLLLI